MNGKSHRLHRVLSPITGRALIVPLDHAISIGVASGLEDLRGVARIANDSGADALVVHKGALRVLLRSGDPTLLSNLGLIVHLSASTSLSPTPSRKTLVCSVDEALELGADMVSVHTNLGCAHESEMISDLATVSETAMRRGVPLLVMAYVRDDVGAESTSVRDVVHAARVAEELGADLIKVSFPGVPGVDALRTALRTPFVVAGGSRMEVQTLMDRAGQVMASGASGIAAGRNVFGSENPAKVIDQLQLIVHDESRGVPLSGRSPLSLRPTVTA